MRWSGIIIVVLAVAAVHADGQTRLVRDVRLGSPSSYPTSLVGMSDALFFIADDGERGCELWRSDGTTVGTRLVIDLNPGPGDAFDYEQGLVVLDRKIFFGADDGQGGAQLWASDGTAGGTALVSNVAPGERQTSVRNLVAVGGTLYFMVRTGLHTADGVADGHDRLWKSDGTTAGTVAVADLGLYRPGGFAEIKRVAQLYPFSGMLLATISDETECCQSISVVRVQPSGETESLFSEHVTGFRFGLSAPHNLTVVGSVLFFTVDGRSGDVDCELWRTDGTPAGTLRVSLPTPACGISYLAGAGDTLFFTQYENGGTRLWKVNGSGLQPTMVTAPGNGSVAYDVIRNLTGVGSTLFFAADAGSGEELWKTDGTAAGTLPVRDRRGEPAGSMPAALTNIDGTLLFAAEGGQTGPALWRSDGTPAGTRRVGPLPSPPANPLSPLVSVGNDVFFAARDTAHGAELWALPLRALAGGCPADCDANRAVTVEELVASVNIALGVLSLSSCDAADFNGDQEVTIDELLLAVSRALNGCE